MRRESFFKIFRTGRLIQNPNLSDLYYVWDAALDLGRGVLNKPPYFMPAESLHRPGSVGRSTAATASLFAVGDVAVVFFDSRVTERNQSSIIWMSRTRTNPKSDYWTEETASPQVKAGVVVQ